MIFLKRFLTNLAAIIILGLIVYIIYPDIMQAVFETYWLLFGPIAIFMIIVFALPQSRGKRR